MAMLLGPVAGSPHPGRPSRGYDTGWGRWGGGEWTRVECICDGDRITVLVNEQIVNRCRDAAPAAGKILLQSEGFELFVRRFELHPLAR